MRKWKGPQIPRSLLHSMYEVHTEGGGYDKEQGGQWKPGTTVETAFQGVVMPLNNEDLQYIDSGSYTLNAQKVYTNGHTLQVGAQFRDGFDGQIYTVKQELTHGPVHSMKRYMVEKKGESKEYVNEYGRSVVTYADNLAEWADAAWVGSVGPFWPESVTWKWKVPDGVSVADLRDSERDLLEENRVNFMTAEYKHEYMKNGICGDGNFIDNVLGADYITHQIRENLYEIFIANKKIAYTDDGFALVAAGVFAALNRAVELHIIATDPEDDTGVYTVVIPKRADATDEQARNRQMPDIKWSAQLEGAVHSVKVNGTLRVTLNG